MRKLTRKWKQSQIDPYDDKFSLPTLDDSRPIDTQEQEEMVRSFEKSQVQQSLLWRWFSFVMLSSSFIQYISRLCLRGNWLLGPVLSMILLAVYEQRYHAYFMEEIDSQMVILADWAAVIACSMAMIGLIRNTKQHRRWFWCSGCAGILLAFFWLYNMLRLLKFRWEVLWLPLAPLNGAGMCLYVDNLLTESSEEVRKLRGYMYAYKTK